MGALVVWGFQNLIKHQSDLFGGKDLTLDLVVRSECKSTCCTSWMWSNNEQTQQISEQQLVLFRLYSLLIFEAEWEILLVLIADVAEVETSCSVAEV